MSRLMIDAAVAAALRAEIEAAWFQIENAFDLEPRSYFEAEAPKNGFGSPLAMAVFYLFKRDPKVEPLRAALKQAGEALVRYRVNHMNQAAGESAGDADDCNCGACLEALEALSSPLMREAMQTAVVKESLTTEPGEVDAGKEQG